MEIRKESSINELIAFLKDVDQEFIVPLSEKVNLEEYAKKLQAKASILLAKDKDSINGLVAGYVENIVNNSAYITLVIVKKQYRGTGIAKELLNEFIKLCYQKGNIKTIELHTSVKNLSAIKFYTKAGFREHTIQDRKCEKRMIYYLD